MKQSRVVGDVIVGNLEVSVPRGDVGVPADALDHGPVGVVFMSRMDHLIRVLLKQLPHHGVLLVPCPPLHLLNAMTAPIGELLFRTGCLIQNLRAV